MVTMEHGSMSKFLETLERLLDRAIQHEKRMQSEVTKIQAGLRCATEERLKVQKELDAERKASVMVSR